MMKWLKHALPLLLLTAIMISPFVFHSTADNPDEQTVRLPIVMYHQLSTNKARCGRYVLPVEQFENDLVWLKDNGYTAVTTGQLTAYCRGEDTLPEKPVMITFDDGYESTYVYAKPLLEQYGMTAVVSVIGSVCRKYTDEPDHTVAYAHMDYAEVADAEQSGILDMQCHTYHMHELSPRRGCAKEKGESNEAYAEALKNDIEQFQTEFTEATGSAATAIALPYGSYSDTTLPLLEEMGFSVIFNCEERVNLLRADPQELYTLGRYNRPTGKSSAAFFQKWETE